jgi:hypothetical protein
LFISESHDHSPLNDIEMIEASHRLVNFQQPARKTTIPSPGTADEKGIVASERKRLALPHPA